MRLKIEFLGFWRVGTGAGHAGRLDLLSARDCDELPYVPGRQLRGILREAVREADAYGWNETPQEARLFGKRAIQPGASGGEGALRVDSARMLSEDRSCLYALDAKKKTEAVAQLFAQRRSTAIDPVSGTAKQHSLRTMEIVIPLTLEANVEALAEAGDWQATLETALPLIRAMGAERSRGLGRCRVSVMAPTGGGVDHV